MRPIIWIVGAGGLLGGGLRRAVVHGYDVHECSPVDWNSRNAKVQVGDAAKEFAVRAAGRDWVVAWCAGAGVIGTDVQGLRRGTDFLDIVLQNLPDDRAGVVFLASSAGGVYAGSTTVPIDEASADAPISDYGMNKLAQEEMVKNWTHAHGGRGLVGRISNLYGPGQSLSKPQGLISQVCLATLTRRPVSIYVSTDTVRDYLYVDDCGRMITEAIARSRSIDPGACVTKIFAASRSVSIGGILAEARRVLGRRPTTVMIPSDRSQLQGSALSFRSHVWSDLDDRDSTTLPEGIDKTTRGIQALLQESGIIFAFRD